MVRRVRGRQTALAVALLAGLAALGASRPVPAQDSPPDGLSLGQVQSQVLTIDTERLFSASLFGLRVAAELRRQTEDLAAENRRIEAALTAEEQSLTDRRPDMTIEAFRAEAQSFDERVQGIRSAQDAKERALQTAVTQGRDAFLSAAAPVLGDLMRSAGASVILDRRSVFLALGAVDITDEAIAAIDAAIGDGADLLSPPQEQVPPDPAPPGPAPPDPAPPDPAPPDPAP